MIRIKIGVKAAVMAFVALSATQLSHAQIIGQIQVSMSHPFVVGTTTLPPGTYDLRVVSKADMTVMTATSTDGSHAPIEFLVRQSEANHVPRHTELVFDRYGNQEFLRRIYEKGNRFGVAVEETSKEEARLVKDGQHAIEHTEEMQQ